MKLWQIIVVAVLALAAAGGAGYYGYQSSRPPAPEVAEPPTAPVERGDVTQSVTAPGHMVDAGETTLLARVNGQVETVLARPGDPVEAGQLLAELGERGHFEAAVTDAQIQVIQAQMALEEQQSGLPLAEARLALSEAQKAYDKAARQRESKQYARSSQENIDIAQSNYVIAEDGVTRATENYDRVDDRPENDPVRAEAFSQLAAARQQRDKALGNLNWLLGKPNEQEIAEADAQLALAEAQLNQAQRKYDTLLKDGGPVLALAEANLRKAEMQLEEAEASLASLTVTAPFSGVVTEVNIQPGQMVTEGLGLLVLSDPQKLVAEVSIVEEDFPLLEVGQKAELFFDALPEAEVRGTVSQIVPRRASGDRALYTVYICLDSIPDKLASGMTVDSSIVIQGKEGVLRLPRALVRARADNSAIVDVWAEGVEQEREIWVGLRGDSYVEIISGLEEGELVIAR